jgi:hypothetical protein
MHDVYCHSATVLPYNSPNFHSLLGSKTKVNALYVSQKPANKLLKTNKETLVQMPLFCAIFYETNYNFSTNIEILKSHWLQR